MIEFKSLTKHYGSKTAVNGLSFVVKPGRVTGFLGPNGAGKSTTMRLLLGLDKPDAGEALIDGESFAQLRSPMTKVGALLDPRAAYPGRNGRDHLMALAATHHIPYSRVDEVIDLAGLGQAAKRKVGGYSLGMSQRLGIAAALLGDPEILVLDEPVNGLDPEGVIWIRNLMKTFAAEGRTVFVSSHMMSEMSQVADDLVIIGRGRLITAASLEEVLLRTSGHSIQLVSPQFAEISVELAALGYRSRNIGPQQLQVDGITGREFGRLAAGRNWAIYQMSDVVNSLEDAYLDLTEEAVEYRGNVNESELEGARR
jgi:ABC-2 type transport system ATP-binding protein